MKHWEIIANNLSKAGFSWGCSSESDSTGRVLFSTDAYAPDGRRFTVLADDKLTAFLELHAAIDRQLNSMKYWQIIIENLRNAGWNCGCMATTDGKGRPIWVVAAEREDTLYCAIGRTFVIRGISYR